MARKVIGYEGEGGTRIPAELERAIYEAQGSATAVAIRHGVSLSAVRTIRRRGPREATPRERLAAVTAGAWRAACMDEEEWEHWLSTNPPLRDTDLADRPCTDCPLGFAADMRTEGRCNGTPGWQPPDEEGEREPEPIVRPRLLAVGVATVTAPPVAIPSPPEEEPVVVESFASSEPFKDVATVELPCSGCLHAPICRIRHELGDKPMGLIGPATLPAGVRLDVVARLICEHRLLALAEPAVEPREGVTCDDAAPTSARTARAARQPSAADARAAAAADGRAREVLAAIERHGGDRKAAGAELGLRGNVLARIVQSYEARQAAANG